MSKKYLAYSLVAILLICSFSLTARAEEGRPNGPQRGGPLQRVEVRTQITASTTVHVNRPEHQRDEATTTHREMEHGTSTKQKQEKDEKGDRGMKDVKVILGIVKSVSTNSFTLDARIEKNATTTFTINTVASTTFRNGTTTGTLSNLTVGTTAIVTGKVASSTNTITADRVVFGFPFKVDAPNEGHDKGVIHGVGNFIKSIFGKPGNDKGTVNASSTTTASIDASQGMIGKVIHALFGWLK